MNAADELPSPRRALVIAALLVLGIEKLVPFGRLLLYPFTLFATWVHEMGHGLGALVVGGGFSKLEIFANASGLAYTNCAPGWRQALVSVAGLLGPPLVGSAIILLSRGARRARLVLALLSLAMLASMAIWVRSTAGLIAVPLVALLTGAVAWGASPRWRLYFAQVLGVTLALDTITGVDYLFTKQVTIDGKQQLSDIASVAEVLGGHYLLWGVLVTALSLALLGVALYLTLMPPKRKP